MVPAGVVLTGVTGGRVTVPAGMGIETGGMMGIETGGMMRIEIGRLRGWLGWPELEL